MLVLESTRAADQPNAPRCTYRTSPIREQHRGAPHIIGAYLPILCSQGFRSYFFSPGGGGREVKGGGEDGRDRRGGSNRDCMQASLSL